MVTPEVEADPSFGTGGTLPNRGRRYMATWPMLWWRAQDMV
jgi:hypothetical protein